VSAAGEPAAASPANEPLLRVEHLSLFYGEARALHDVSFEVSQSRALAVLGANGAGKSSLAATLAGVIHGSGSIRFCGTEVSGWSAHRASRAGIAYIPEGRGIFPHLSVIDNLRTMLRYAVPAGGLGEAVDRASEIFPILGERRRQAAGTLSGGEQQMLALARVLAVPPRLLIADEMSLGLAPMLVDVVFESLGRARESGVTVVLVEQYAERALGFADEALILRRGRVAWTGTALDAHDAVVAGYLGEVAGKVGGELGTEPA
jgi:branched-chain amino acid transport system ATP-binding protein